MPRTMRPCTRWGTEAARRLTSVYPGHRDRSVTDKGYVGNDYALHEDIEQHILEQSMWPKGDAWGGGGLFKNERTIQLNHRAAEMTPAPDMRLPRKITVEPLGTSPGWGEDDPILSMRMTRDGWVLRDAGAAQHHSFGAKLS